MVKKIIPILTTGGICLQYDKEHEKYINKIKELYTLKHFGFNNSLAIARGYKVFSKKQVLVLPKFGIDEFLDNEKNCKPFNKLGIYKRGNIIDALKECDDLKYIEKDNFTWTGCSNDYQKLVIETVMYNYFSKTKVRKGLSGVVLNLPTGHGKTFVAMAIMNILKLSTLVVCPRIKVANQWCDLLSKFFPDVKIGVFHSMRKRDGDIIVGVVDSFANCSNFILNDHDVKKNKNNYNVKEFYKRWGLVIFDECHNYSTKVNSLIFRRIGAQYTLGLSATPNKGNFSLISQWNIGSVLDSRDIDEYAETYKREKTVPIFKGRVIGIKYHGSSEYTKNIVGKNGYIIPYKMLDQIMSDPYRLSLITKRIIELCNKDYCTLVFSDRIAYLRQIQEKLKNSISTLKSIILDDIKDIHQVITGGATDEEMDCAYKSSKIILTTYAFFMEGISIPRINAIIYATPRRTGIEQSNGRCIRPSMATNIKQRNKENNKERVIIDIIDWGISLKNQWYTRKKIYNSMHEIGAKFNIIMEDINYDEI